MKKYFSILLWFIFCGLSFAVPKYLGLVKAGDSTGSSWTNAQGYLNANAFKRPDNSALVGGDTVYFNGGSDSVVYGKTQISSLAPSSQVVITNGKDAGHNGRVIFAQSGTPTGSKSSFELLVCQNIKLYGMTFKTAITGVYAESILKITGCTNCIIDHDTIYNNVYGHGYNDGGNGFGIYMNGTGGHPSKKITITNNYIECFTNNDPAMLTNGERD